MSDKIMDVLKELREILEELAERECNSYSEDAITYSLLALQHELIKMLPREIGGLSCDNDEQVIEEMGLGISELKAIGYNKCISDMHSKIMGITNKGEGK